MDANANHIRPQDEPGPADRPVRGAYLWAVLLLAVIALVHTLPIFADLDNYGIEDWDQHFFYHAVPRATILEYRQIPLWNPYYCGGAPLLGNPQSRVCAPTFPLVLLFDVVRGLKLEVWVNLVIGLTGAYVLARHYRLTGAAAFLLPCLYLLSTMYSLILTSGSTNFLSIAYLPWTVWAFVKSLDKLPWAVAAGAFLALTYLSGGHWVVPIVVLFLALYAVCSVFTHGPLRSAAALVLTGLLAAGFGAVKIIPSLEMMSAYPRPIPDYSGYSVAGLGHMLLDRDQALSRFHEFEQVRGFWTGLSAEMTENGMYVGLVPLGLCLIGLCSQARHWKWALAWALFLWLCLGSRAPLSLWDGLHKLPVYDNLQIASRFRIIFLLGLAFFAGWGLQWVVEAVRRYTRKGMVARAVGWVLLAAIVADLIMVTRPIFGSAFPIDPRIVLEDLKRSDRFVQIQRLPAYSREGFRDNLDWFDFADIEDVPVDVSYSALYVAFLHNLGSIRAYEAIPVPAKAVPKDSPQYRGEAFMDNIRGTAHMASWSPNRLVVNVDAFDQDRLVINQNYAPGWKARGVASEAAPSGQGLLSAAVTPDTRQVTFYYRPASFFVGAAVSAVTLVGCALFLLRCRRKTGQTEEKS